MASRSNASQRKRDTVRAPIVEVVEHGEERDEHVLPRQRHREAEGRMPIKLAAHAPPKRN
jgi:hypothetical protein